MKPWLKNTLKALLAVLVIIQFIRPERNTSGRTDNSIKNAFRMHTEVEGILRKACYDCHSNNTVYPWYSNVQPVAWWLQSHINEGKEHLNFDEFINYRPYRQYHMLEEIDETVSEGEMPLSSYTVIHGNAKLNQEEKDLLIGWTKSLRDSMKATYPAESLIPPSKKDRKEFKASGNGESEGEEDD